MTQHNKKTGKKVTPGSSFTNCQFSGVTFDAKAVNAIEKIAEGLIENAKGLAALACVLKASGVNVECLVKIVNDDKP